jgi:hypothetical protein
MPDPGTRQVARLLRQTLRRILSVNPRAAPSLLHVGGNESEVTDCFQVQESPIVQVAKSRAGDVGAILTKVNSVVFLTIFPTFGSHQ